MILLIEALSGVLIDSLMLMVLNSRISLGDVRAVLI